MDEQVHKKLETFFTQFKQQKYRKGEIIIRADDDPMGIYYLAGGQVRMYLITSKGDEIVLNIFKPISFFPMSWAMNGTKNSYYYEAATEVFLCRAPKDAVLAFLKENPDVLFNLLSRVYKGLDGLLSRMAHLMSASAYSRLIIELIITARRFGIQNDAREILITISEKNLGTQTGLTRETVSREMKVLKDKGLVALNKNVLTIKQLDLLEAEL